MMIRALYPGTFDPLHNGHLDIARRAAAIFEELVIGVYHSPPKKLLFTTEERVELAQIAVADLSNVSVVPFVGLTVECARAISARVIVRGLRNVADYQFESQIGLANRHLSPEVELCCLICSTEYTYLSSTIVKEVAGLGGDVSDWVAEPVAMALNERLIVNQAANLPEVGSNAQGVSKTRGKMSHRG
jgi:pantetheine-phosphate adenylyltransferase